MMMNIDKYKLLKRVVIIGILMGTVSFIVINKYVKPYGYSSVFDIITTYNANSSLANNVNPINLKLNISDSDYGFLKDRRQVALDRGLQINDIDGYVPCWIVSDSDTVQGKMRLKGHMTDHLEGDKWSFRVKSENKTMGMYLFVLRVCSNVSISNSSSKVPKPPGKTIKALAR